MELKHAHPNGENVVANYLHYMHILLFLKIEIKTELRMLFFSKKFPNYPQNKVSHIF